MSAPGGMVAAFEGVDLWIFDLDNTLYGRPEPMWRAIHARMRGFIREALGVEDDEAEEIQLAYYRKYGLTMRGLMIHHGIDPDAYNAYVHDVDLSIIPPNPALGAAIRSLPGRRVIHTNSDKGHTARVLARLGIEDAFDAVYDIASAGYLPKPRDESYDAVLEGEGADPRSAAMFEDTARNLLAPHALGMRTVWTPSGCDWAGQGADGAHVHFVADDLTGFVRDVAEGRAAA